MLHHDSLTILQIEPCTLRDMSSFAPCLHEEADTIKSAHATEAAKGLTRKYAVALLELM